MHSIEEFLAYCNQVEGLEPQDPYEYPTMSWVSSRRDGRALTFGVHFHTASEDMPAQTWQIRIEGVREFNWAEGQLVLRPDASARYDLARDHPLLWGFKDDVSQLNFTGPVQAHAGLLWDLYEAHRRLTGGWVPFERYLYEHFIHNRLSGGHGVLAVGPDRQVQEYPLVLRGSDLEPYFPYPPHPPVRVYGGESLMWRAEDPNLSVLILDGSYVIGTGFSAERR